MSISVNKAQSNWQLQDAKSRFSSVVKKAETGVPQLVTRNGVPTVYIVEAKSFDKLTKKTISRKEVLKMNPCKELELDLDCVKSLIISLLASLF
jgi:prevent-host-death family protein